MKREVSKRAAAIKAVDEVQDGMIVGLGTGTTAGHMLEILAQRVRSGLSIVGVPTSEATKQKAIDLKIPLLEEYPDFGSVDLTIDGADEVDAQKRLSKGGGGALLREKLVAIASRRLIIIVDETKLVKRLGVKFPLPVEIVAFGWQGTLERLSGLGLEVTLRRNRAGKIFRTDHGNFIADCRAKGGYEQPEELESQLKLLPGVVETGLFVKLKPEVIVGCESGKAYFV